MPLLHAIGMGALYLLAWAFVALMFAGVVGALVALAIKAIEWLDSLW